MYLLLWIMVGLSIGWLAGKHLEGNGYGPSVDLTMGAGGGVIGGLVMRAMGVSGYGGILLTTFVVICGAALLTVLVAMANGRTIYKSAF